MSNVVTAVVTIGAPPSTVWKTVMDPERMADWVTIHKQLIDADPGPPRVGMAMHQVLMLRGVPFKVRWKLTECVPEALAVWEGEGPMGSTARTRYELSGTPEGTTLFSYENEFRAPGGPLGKAASRVLVGGLPEKEAEGSLQLLRRLIES